MSHGYYDDKDLLSKRVNRIAGQVRGIGRMVEEDKYCIDILTQVSAAKSALDKLTLELVRDHARHCLAGADSEEERKAKADELVNALGRMS